MADENKTNFFCFYKINQAYMYQKKKLSHSLDWWRTHFSRKPFLTETLVTFLLEGVFNNLTFISLLVTRNSTLGTNPAGTRGPGNTRHSRQDRV